MRKSVSILLTLLLLAVLGTAGAQGIGVSLQTFEDHYAQGVQFINDNTGRRLLPHSLTRDFDGNGDRMYRLDKGALHMELYLSEMQISRLVIVLTAPPYMTYGSAEYNDFAVAGYHSYALLMAMSPEETNADRYSLVDMVNWGIKQYGGFYELEVGDYRLKCESYNGAATMTFENALLIPQATPQPDADEASEAGTEEADDPAGEDEENSLAG